MWLETYEAPKYDILDFENGVINPLFTPEHSANNKQSNGVGGYIQYSNTSLSGAAYWGGGIAKFMFTTGIKRGNATKLYIDVTTTFPGSYSQWFALTLLENKQLPNRDLNIGFNPEVYYKIYNVVYPYVSGASETIRKIYEFDISDIPSEKLVYLAFDTCELGFNIHSIYFDNDILIV